MAKSAKKYLLIRFSSIGDIVLTSPIIRCLKEQTGAEIHFLTKSSYSNWLSQNPNIDRVWSMKSDIGEHLEALKRERFDAVIDLHKSLRSRFLRFKLGVPAYDFPKLNFQKLLLCRFGIDRMPKDQHVVDRYFQAVKPLGVHSDGQGLDFFFSPSLPGDDKLKTEIANLKGSDYVSIVLAATYPTKRIPVDLCLKIIKNCSVPAVLLGGPDVKDLAEQIIIQSNTPVYNFVAKLSLAESAQVMNASKGIISPDTGLMHIGAALKKPMVVVWGNTIPAFGMEPYYGKGERKHFNAEVLNLSCRPCSKLGSQTCPKGHFNCMTNQNRKAISSKIETWLSE